MNRVAVLVGAMVLASSVGAQERRLARDGAFEWSERIPAGAWLRIHNVNGTIDVRAASGRTAEVRAEVEPTEASRDDISFEVLRDGSSYTICAIWTENTTCDENGIDSRGRGRRRNAKVRFTVFVPSGVQLKVATGNGDVTVQDAGADVIATSGNGRVHVLAAAGGVKASSGNGEIEVLDAGGPVTVHTGNGQVRVTTALGPVDASSGNGDIDVQMNALEGAEDMTFRSGNGTIVVAVPRGFEGELETTSGNGKFRSDFAIVVQGRVDPSRFHGTIGKGGRRLRMSTGNGNLELRRVE